MMYTFVHTKQVSSTLWDVGHLYEHMFFENFYDLVRSKGIDPGVIGYMAGETFQDIIFVNVGFYAQDIAQMYEEYLSSHTVNPAYIDVGIGGCEAEERLTFEIDDRQELLRQLKTFDALPWEEVANIGPRYIVDSEPEKSSVINSKKTAKRFRTLGLALYLENPTRYEAVVWLRLSIIMDDVLTRALRHAYPSSYALYSEPTLRRDNVVLRAMEHRFERNVSVRRVRNSMQAILKNFDVQSNMPYILAHMTAYGEQRLSEDLSIDLYRHTGYVVGNKKIAELATPELIEQVINKLQVRVRAV